MQGVTRRGPQSQVTGKNPFTNSGALGVGATSGNPFGGMQLDANFGGTTAPPLGGGTFGSSGSVFGGVTNAGNLFANPGLGGGAASQTSPAPPSLFGGLPSMMSSPIPNPASFGITPPPSIPSPSAWLQNRPQPTNQLMADSATSGSFFAPSVQTPMAPAVTPSSLGAASSMESSSAVLGVNPGNQTDSLRRANLTKPMLKLKLSELDDLPIHPVRPLADPSLCKSIYNTGGPFKAGCIPELVFS